MTEQKQSLVSHLDPAPAYFFALGFLFVAVVCAYAGHALGSKSLEMSEQSSLQIVAYLFLLFPTYLNRSILYEQDNIGKFLINKGDNTERFQDDSMASLVANSWKWPALIFSLSVIISIAFYVIIYRSNSLVTKSFLAGIWSICFASLPLVAYAVWMTASTDRDQFLQFKYRCFFPAVLTCTLPFSFGWSVSNMHRNLYGITLPALAIASVLLITVVADKFSSNNKIFKFLTSENVLLWSFGVLVLTTLIVPMTGWGSFSNNIVEAMQVFGFGLLMSLVMGVCESWNLCTRVRDGVDVIANDSYVDGVRADEFYLAGTNLAASVLGPLFLITILHPSTSSLYVYTILFYLVFQYSIWFIWGDRWKYKTWWILRLIFGITVPVLISIGCSFGKAIEPNSFIFKIPPSWFVILSFIGAIVLVILNVHLAQLSSANPSQYLEAAKTFVNRLFNVLSYKNKHFAHIASATLCIVVVFVLTVIEPVYAPNDADATGAEIAGGPAETLQVPIDGTNNLSGYLLGVADGDKEHNKLAYDYDWERFRLLQAAYILFIALLLIASVVSFPSSGDGVGSPKRLKKRSVTVQIGSDTPPERPGMLRLLKVCMVTARPLTSSIAYTLTSSCLIAAGSSPLVAFFRGMPMFFVVMAGFVINDIYDLEKDKAAGKNRPIAMGMLDTRSASIFFLGLVVIAIIIELMHCSQNSLIVLVYTIIGISAYSLAAVTLPKAKGVFTAVLCCSPLMYANAIIGRGTDYILVGLVFSFIIGREVLLDVGDYNGDLAYGIKTLPVTFGLHICKPISWGIMIVSVVGLVGFTDTSLSRFLAVGGLLTLTYCIFIGRKDEVAAIKASRIPMLLGALSVAIG